jgi:hypothetical protein
MDNFISAADAKLANEWRARMLEMSDAELRVVVADDANRMILREMAQVILAARSEWTRQLREEVEGAPEPSQVAADTNQSAAERFAKRLTEAGFPAHAVKTLAVQGRKVKDGWAVNMHDADLEIGVVAAWWGRGHFTAYAEIAGHRERSDEAAELLLYSLRAANGRASYLLRAANGRAS